MTFIDAAREWLVRAQGHARPEHEQSLADELQRAYELGVAHAQAPAMARLLLAHEWNREGYCPECGQPRELEGQPVGHEPDCQLATVLRAAGVLP